MNIYPCQVCGSQMPRLSRACTACVDEALEYYYDVCAALKAADVEQMDKKAVMDNYLNRKLRKRSTSF